MTRIVQEEDGKRIEDLPAVLWSFCDRQAGGEFHLAVAAAHVDAALVGQDDGLCDGEAQAVVLTLAGAGRVRAVEALEDLLLGLGRDGRPRVNSFDYKWKSR